MSVWTTPATWSNGAVTAATMNTEVRDHFNWLKNALDLITNSTSADTGTATGLFITRTTATDEGFATKVTGDADWRVKIRAGGGYQLGDGTAAPQVVMSFSGGILTFDRMVQAAAAPTKLFTKAGAIADADIPGYFTGSGTGMIGVDTTNSRLYVRVGATWKFAALT